MENKAIIDCIKEFFKECPYIKNLDKINVDYLDYEVKDSYSIEQESGQLEISRNVTGTKSFREIRFIFASRLFFNPNETEQNSNNLKELEKICEWVYEKNLKKELPKLNDKEEATSITLDRPFLFGVNKDFTIARYQMSGTLQYERRLDRWQTL